MSAAEVFAGAGKSSGVEIWRIEQLKPVKQPEAAFGNFYTGDAYIVLHTEKTSEGSKHDIHFWIGLQSSQDESGAAAILATELDEHLGGKAKQYREVQESESAEFAKVFQGKLKYLQGGVASGFKHVEAAEVQKALVWIKGKQQSVRVKEVPLSATSLNSGDVFALTAADKIYQWNGKESKASERSKAQEVVSALKESQGGDVEVVVLEEGEAGEEADAFFVELGEADATTGAAKVQSAQAGGEDAASASQPPKLFKVDSSSGSVTTTELTTSPLSRNLLDSSATHILATGAAVYVWLGKGAASEERKSAMAAAPTLLEQLALPKSTPVSLVKEGDEDQAFQKFFPDWSGAKPAVKASPKPAAAAAKAKAEEKSDSGASTASPAGKAAGKVAGKAAADGAAASSPIKKAAKEKEPAAAFAESLAKAADPAEPAAVAAGESPKPAPGAEPAAASPSKAPAVPGSTKASLEPSPKVEATAAPKAQELKPATEAREAPKAAETEPAAKPAQPKPAPKPAEAKVVEQVPVAKPAEPQSSEAEPAPKPAQPKLATKPAVPKVVEQAPVAKTAEPQKSEAEPAVKPAAADKAPVAKAAEAKKEPITEAAAVEKAPVPMPTEPKQPVTAPVTKAAEPKQPTAEKAADESVKPEKPKGGVPPASPRTPAKPAAPRENGTANGTPSTSPEKLSPRMSPSGKRRSSGEILQTLVLLPSELPPPRTPDNLKFVPGTDTIPYEELKEMKMEAGINPLCKEDYLTDDDFEKVFKKDRAAFKAMPLWRQQNAKKEVGLF